MLVEAVEYFQAGDSWLGIGYYLKMSSRYPGSSATGLSVRSSSMSFCRLKRGLSPSRVLISLPVSRSCPRWLKAPMRLRAGSDILVLVWGVLVVGEIEDG